MTMSLSLGLTLTGTQASGSAPPGYSYLIDKNGVVMLDARGNKILMRVRING